MSLRDFLRRVAQSVLPGPSAAAARPEPDAGRSSLPADDQVVPRAAAAVGEGRSVLGSVLPSQLRRLDVDLRLESPWSSSWISALCWVSPTLVKAVAEASGDSNAAAILLAGNANGRVREAAIPLLGRRPTPLCVGMLVVRSSDWVPEVRALAQSALRQVVAREGSDVLLPALPLIEQLSASDARCRPFALEMLDLARTANPTALRSALHSPDRRARRSSARLLARPGVALLALEDALAQDDPITLALVAEAALADAPVSVVERLSRPPAIARVRALALRRLLDGASGLGAVHAEGALLDRSATVRVLAQSYLQHSGVDVVGLYSAHLDKPDPTRGTTEVAVRGLAELGSTAHLPKLASLASHSSARVREAVCIAIESLGPVDQRDVLFAFVRDSSRRVARRAGLVLVRSRLDATHLDRLWECAARRADRSLFPAFASLDRWRQLLYSARALRAGRPLVKEFGAALLDNAMATWNSSFTSPPAPLREELGEALPRVLPSLDVERAALLRHSLRPFLPDI